VDKSSLNICIGSKENRIDKKKENSNKILPFSNEFIVDVIDGGFDILVFRKFKSTVIDSSRLISERIEPS